MTREGPLLVGLTGSIGMGKSTTSAMFAELGIPVWDADAAVHRLYSEGGKAVEPIRRAFPEAVPEHAVDRTKLKAILARDPDALGLIEGIVHPLVGQDRADFIANCKAEIVVLDIPLLFETGAENWLDVVLVVSTDAETQRSRVLQRPGMTQEQFDLILSRQLPDEKKRQLADFVIRTDDMESTRKQVSSIVSELRRRKSDA